MPPDIGASWLLAQEAHALLTRLARVKPLALHETMVPAAAVSPTAQTVIETYLVIGRRELYGLVRRFLAWLHGAEGRHATAAQSAATLYVATLALQRRPDAVRHLRGCDDAAERTRDRCLAGRARRRRR